MRNFKVIFNKPRINNAKIYEWVPEMQRPIPEQPEEIIINKKKHVIHTKGKTK